MCGIAGIVNFSGEAVAAGEIKRVTDLVAHRGPDGSGYYTDRNLALGHRRLSIIDLSDASSQPMIFQEKYVIVFNGEIYNYIEVRNELQGRGYQFRTSGDTEVILAAFDLWKEECVHKFNGMWAFCIYDKSANSLFCSRDRFGVKPFYYTVDHNSFRFGSEIRQLILPSVQPKANLEVLANYLILGLEDYCEDTFFSTIKKLNPAHNLICNLNDGSVKIESYYSISIDKSVSDLSLEESSNLFLKELTRSVSYRLRSDVQVGTCLSGGLDSSMIASLASSLYQNSADKKFTAITATSLDSKNDETAFAQKVAQYSNLNWITTTPSISDFTNVITDVVRAQEEPFGSPSVFMQYFVMQKAREAGCPVLLDGQGGDETLLGYQRYYPSYLMSLNGLNKLRGLFKSSANSGSSPVQLIKSYFYFTNASLRIQRQLKRSNFLKSEFSSLINRRLVDDIANSYNDIKKLQILELTTTQLPHLLKYEDKNSMHFSIETRLPFLDYKLVELSLSLSDSFKIKDGYSKYILRNASKNILPSEISWRKNKIGFEAPAEVWLKDNKFMYEAIKSSEILDSLMHTVPDIQNDKVLLWRLYNIAKWEEVFNVGKG